MNLTPHTAPEGSTLLILDNQPDKLLTFNIVKWSPKGKVLSFTRGSVHDEDGYRRPLAEEWATAACARNWTVLEVIKPDGYVSAKDMKRKLKESEEYIADLKGYQRNCDDRVQQMRDQMDKANRDAQAYKTQVAQHAQTIHELNDRQPIYDGLVSTVKHICDTCCDGTYSITDITEHCQNIMGKIADYLENKDKRPTFWQQGARANLTVQQIREVDKHLDNGNTINAIKLIRECGVGGLADSKACCDDWRAVRKPC
jgi:hypothetical protein